MIVQEKKRSNCNNYVTFRGVYYYMHSRKILIADDSKGLVYVVDALLRRMGYRTICTYNGKDAIETALAENLSLAIIDIGLPDISGLTVIDRVNEINSKLPIIAISGPKDINNEIAIYNKGAIIFHKKPLEFRLLEAQIRNLAPRNKRNVIEMKGIKIDCDIGTISKNHITTLLTKNEVRCLTFLIEANGNLCSRESILRRLNLDTNEKTEHSVDTLICRLRKKFGYPNREAIIETVNGRGYRILNSRKI